MPRRIIAVLALLVAPSLWAQPQVPAPQSLSGRRLSLTLSVPSLRDVDADAAQLAAWLSSCRVALPVQAADSAVAVSRPQPSPAMHGVIAISVQVPPLLPVDCRTDDRAVAVAATRQLQLAASPDSRDGAVPMRARLLRDDREVQLVESRRVPLRRLSPNGFVDSLPDVLELFVAFDQLEPTVRGSLRDVRVEVLFRDGTRDTIPIAMPQLQTLWESVLAQRAANLSGSRATLQLEATGGPMLVRAVAAAHAGDHRAAVGIAHPLWYQPAMTRRDAVTVFAQIGASLYALGDDAGARVAFMALFEREPCATFSDAMDSQLRQLIDSLSKPRARCRTQSAPVTALRALAFPGFGRSAVGDGSERRFAILGLIAATAGTAVLLNSEAQRRYDIYLNQQVPVPPSLNAPGPPPASYYYDQAESVRKLALLSWRATGTLWVLQALMDTRAERAYAARVRSVRGLGREAERVSFMINPTGSGARVGVRLEW